MKKTNRPVIGITTSMQDKFIRMNRAYFDAVLDAGGLPVFLPFSGGADDAARFLPLCDGIIFAGGVDVDPKHYGEEIKFDTVEVTPLRDEFELALAQLIKDSDVPVLGICRGEQLLNVALGGTLHQHIESHAQTEPGARNLRHVKLTEGTLLSRITGKDELFTNSFHHQAVKDVAPGMVAAAVADDGIIEAVEPEGAAQSNRFFLAVQWHPELFYKTDAAARAIFAAFIEAARS